MARIRTIKPSFFVSEELAALKPLARLLFISLWTLADKAGRIEDRPRRIKVEALPHDKVDVDALLCDLAGAGFIDRYEADGVKCIQIINFHKHQRPHPKEPATELPDPAVKKNGRVVHEPGKKTAGCALREGVSLETKGREGVSENCDPPEPEPVQPSPEKTKTQDEPIPPQTWQSFLATEWRFYFADSAPSQRDLASLAKFFNDLIETGHDPTKLLQRIRARDRPKREPTWEFAKFFSPQKGNSRGNAMESARQSYRIREGAGTDSAS